jgi:tetratricopeptide (TPR) repeat protein
LAVSSLALVAMDKGDYSEAARLYEEASLTIFRTLQDKHNLGIVLHNLGDLAHREGAFERATAFLEECVGVSQQIGNRRLCALTILILGSVVGAMGDHARAQALEREALDIELTLSDNWSLACVFDGMARTCVSRGKPERALRLAGVAATLRVLVDARLSPDEENDLDRVLDNARASLGPDASTRAFADGMALPLNVAVRYALDDEAESI